MFHRFHDRFGTAGLVVAVFALVLALTGGAFAATGGLTAKQKKEVKKIAKGFQGTGPAGPTGPAGTNGKDGTNGTDGTNGADGNSVTGTPIATGGACGVPTGVKYTLNAVSTNVCNGTDGTDGADGTFSTEPLPSGETLTGVYVAYFNAGQAKAQVPISYPIRVSPAPTSMVIPSPALTDAFVINPATGLPVAFLFTEAEVDAYCPGTAANPQAELGALCVYRGTQSEGGTINTTDGVHGSPDPTSGQTIALKDSSTASSGYIDGTWAVTAP